MVDKELIGIWKKMLKPSISSWLLKTNYEGMGEQDKEEFERDFDEILDLALIGLKYKAQLSQEGTTKDATSDTISRQAAIDVLKNRWLKTRNYEGIGEDIAEECEIYLRAMPSSQPEIIRCRECKFASGDSRICMKFDHSPIGELDFCAWAERRTDG